jgi:hypothetical protein
MMEPEEPVTEVKPAPTGPSELALTWAEKKGMANRFGPASGEFTVANPLYQDYAMARAGAGWADDTKVTEAEFDAAVAAVKTHEFR